MTVRYSYVDWLQIFRILAAFCFGVAFGVILVHYVHAQDLDPRYTCLYEFQYPFSEMCNKQRIDNMINQLDQRAQQWDAAMACFASPEMANKFLKDNPDYNVTVPCPPFDKSKYPQDESNK